MNNDKTLIPILVYLEYKALHELSLTKTIDFTDIEFMLELCAKLRLWSLYFHIKHYEDSYIDLLNDNFEIIIRSNNLYEPFIVMSIKELWDFIVIEDRFWNLYQNIKLSVFSGKD